MSEKQIRDIWNCFLERRNVAVIINIFGVGGNLVLGYLISLVSHRLIKRKDEQELNWTFASF